MNRKLRIAIADDDARLRMYFAHLVRLLGHEVLIEAENGEELVAQCQQQPPDLIITDMQMPVMTGLEALDFIWRTQAIPAILVSGVPESQLLAARTAARRPQFLAKPIRMRELTDSIDRAMQRPNASAGGGRTSLAPPFERVDQGSQPNYGKTARDRDANVYRPASESRRESLSADSWSR